jgi:hypothetical protein
MNYDDEDRLHEMRQEYHEMKRRRRNLSCTDGFCGAEDCPKCRPGSYRFAQDEDGEE